MDRLYEDKAVFYLERLVRIGRRVGWWMDRTGPRPARSRRTWPWGTPTSAPPETVGDERTAVAAAVS